MRLAVQEQGYASAAESLVSGNELAAQTATRLAGRLRSYAGMAGDDSTATEFAASYDEAAKTSIEALQSTVGAFGVLGRMVEASVANHARAEAGSILPGWARAVAGPPTVADRAVGVLLAPPPSSLGADDGGPGGPAGMVLGLLQDVFWPNADTDRVRSAGEAWTAAGEAVGVLEAHCRSALAGLEGERSPEIPLAVAVVREVGDRVVDLSTQLGALGSACYEYADHVDAKRSELLSLLEDLVIELGITIAVGGALTFLSGGAAGAAASGVGATRLAAATTRARGILDSLRVLTSGSALTVRPVAVSAGELAVTTERINGARVLLTETSERATGLVHRAGLWRSGWLQAHEVSGSHTLATHVARSRTQLLNRLLTNQKLPYASSFKDQASAERIVARTLDGQSAAVNRWLMSSSPRMKFVDVLGDPTGISASRNGVVSEVHGVRVVLQRDSSMPEGFRVLTAFPQP
jgi:hypothetical protein